MAIGVVHPGEMGAAVGGSLVTGGREVCWASEGRSPETAARATTAGLRDVATVGALARRCDTILSICPPHAAVAVAVAVAGAGFSGRYLDANAVAPATSRTVAAIVEAAGARFVDGGLIGPPPAPGRPVHLWLSGAEADAVAGLFEGSDVRARVARGAETAASALKVCFAAWTKGTAALLLAVRALASAVGVEEELLCEWTELSPELPGQSLRAAQQAARKGWRWVGEMEEIQAAFADAALPSGFHEAAAAVYAVVERTPGADAGAATLEAVLAALTSRAAPPPS